MKNEVIVHLTEKCFIQKSYEHLGKDSLNLLEPTTNYANAGMSMNTWIKVSGLSNDAFWNAFYYLISVGMLSVTKKPVTAITD